VGRSYREAIAALAGMRSLDVWYARLDLDELMELVNEAASRKQAKRAEKNVAKAQTKDSMKAFTKLTEIVDGEPRIVADPPLVVPIEDVAAEAGVEEIEEFVHGVLASYRDSLPTDHRHLLEGFRYAHAARKVVGVGSVGSRAWIVLLLGRDLEDPLFLQLKEAQASVLEPFLGASGFPNHGMRVVAGQRLMQSTTDIMLGWTRIEGYGAESDFYVRQLWDGKGSADVESMDPRALTFYAHVCSWTLARAHARSGDAIAIASYLGKSDSFDRALATFAEAYADQNERDYAALRTAVDSGRVAASALS
jgi:hypothetical protein